MDLLNGDLNVIKEQYKELQNILKTKEDKINGSIKLAREATHYAENLKAQLKQKDEQQLILIRQVEYTKRQLLAAQKKIKTLTGEVVVEMSKHLEGKVKEVEVLKEMLKSSKIELGGKDREIRMLKMKLSAQSKRSNKGNSKGVKKGPPNELTKSLADIQRGSIGQLNIKNKPVPTNNMFFNQNYNEAHKVPELYDMKELELDSSLEKLKGIANINLDIPDTEILPEIHLPAITGAGRITNN